jgi:hypothetical protein
VRQGSALVIVLLVCARDPSLRLKRGYAQDDANGQEGYINKFGLVNLVFLLHPTDCKSALTSRIVFTDG